MRASAIAEAFCIDKGAISRQVQHLVELGLVDRAPDPDDGRATLVSATADAVAPDGRGRPRAAAAGSTSGWRDWSDEDLSSFVALLGRYNAALDDRPSPPHAWTAPAPSGLIAAVSCGRTASAQPDGGVGGQRVVDRPAGHEAPRRPAGRPARSPQLSTDGDRAAPERQHVRAQVEHLDVVAGGGARTCAGPRAPRGRTYSVESGRPPGPRPSATPSRPAAGSTAGRSPGRSRTAAASPRHGIGTRQPSRPGSPVRNQDGSWRCSGATSTSSRPSSSPW